jgi:hypothetical protein
MDSIVAIITLGALVRYLLCCYFLMGVYVGIAALGYQRISAYYLFLWFSAPISAPYTLLYSLCRLLTNLDKTSSER